MQISKQAQTEINNYNFKDRKFIVGDEWLYQITKNNPSNSNKDLIVSKLLIIGRTYAAALERVHEADKKVDYYEVAEEIANSSVENNIKKLKKKKRIDADVIKETAKLHYNLMKIFEKYTNIEKRSLASKYLHFHLPNTVFIYDSRVVKAIGHFVDGKINIKDYPDIQKAITDGIVDKEYVYYCLKAHKIYEALSNNTKFIRRKGSLPRYVDRLLLRYCDKNGI